MEAIKRQYSIQLRDKRFLISTAIGLVLVVASLFANIVAGTYATQSATGPVGDIILSNTPVVNVDDIFVYGPIIFWTIITLYALARPSSLPFWLKTVALFVVVRSVFITLTHIGPFPDHVNVDQFSLDPHINFYIFSSGADLFFSGHTGLPFLMALIFWDDKRMRVFGILAAIFFGVVVLLGHLHYSIDVMAAFFITYTIHHIATKIFPQDLRRFKSGLAPSFAMEPAVRSRAHAGDPR
ncbi:MAG: hypothetical protein KGI45_01160 [Patescibacteria group bacterium]|nr:hypothetical protein [Patescibacteria group bacterium]MDE1941059.1 hypothetical protein [Patescibacteria group bacterium]MDE1966666.1 hypothetical protein [Patescibacteria group bacterium]